jgi:hypothetical protein
MAVSATRPVDSPIWEMFFPLGAGGSLGHRSIETFPRIRSRARRSPKFPPRPTKDERGDRRFSSPLKLEPRPPSTKGHWVPKKPGPNFVPICGQWPVDQHSISGSLSSNHYG